MGGQQSAAVGACAGGMEAREGVHRVLGGEEEGGGVCCF